MVASSRRVSSRFRTPSRQIVHQPSGNKVGIDLGLLSFLTDSEGHTVENPRHYRKAEKKLKRLQRHLSRKKKGSKNRKKARKHLAKAHLKVQRQREDFARKQANARLAAADRQKRPEDQAPSP